MQRPALVPSVAVGVAADLVAARTAFDVLAVALAASNLERVAQIRAMLVAIIARTNVLMLGPPGTGKSRLARQLCAAFLAPYFERLMTRYTMPEELFGPVTLASYQAGKYERDTSGMLPEAVIVFLDEVFKSNSAILNTLLTLMNEGLFHNGKVATRVPLRMMVAASNELPAADAGLAAMLDRWVVRQWVPDVEDDANMETIMRKALPSMTATVTLAQLDTMRAAADAVDITDDAMKALLSIRAKARKAGIIVSPRRWEKACDVLRANAALSGVAMVTTAGFAPLASLMWSSQDQIAKCEEIVKEFSASWVKDIQAISATLDEQQAALNKVKATPSMSQRDRGAEIGTILDVLKGMQGKLTALTANPDASADAASLVTRHGTLERDATKAYRA